MEAFRALLNEAVKIPKNLNSRLEKAGFDGETMFKDHNDSYATLSEVLATAGLGVDVDEWEKLVVNEKELSTLKINSLDEYGKKAGTLKELKLYVMLEKLGRNKLGITIESSR